MFFINHVMQHVAWDDVNVAKDKEDWNKNIF